MSTEKKTRGDFFYPKDILEVCPDAVIYTDNSGKILYANQASRQLSGYTLKHITGSRINEYFTQRSEYVEVLRYCIKKIKENNPGRHSFELKRARGKPIHVEMTFNPYNDNGNTSGVVCVLRDISSIHKDRKELLDLKERLQKIISQKTENLVLANEKLHQEIKERMLIEEQLKESETNFKELADFLPQTVFETDIEGYLTFGNRYAREMFGIGDNDSWEHMKVTDFCAPEERLRAVNSIKTILEGDIIRKSEYIGLKMNGEKFPMRVYSSRKTQGTETVGMRGVIVDISDYKNVEEELRKKQMIFHAVSDSANAGIAATDLDENITYVNNAFAEMTGYTTEELLGMNLKDLSTVSQFNEFQKKTIKRLELNKDYYTAELMHKTGKRIRIQVFASPMIKSDSEVIGTIGVITDLSEREKYESELRKTQSNLSALLNATSETAFLVDITGTVLVANATMANRIGKDIDKIMGTSIYEHFAENTAKLRRQKINQVIATGKPVRFQDERNGLHFDTSMYPVYNSEKKVDRVAIFAKDITAENEAITGLRNSKERYELLFNSGNDIILIHPVSDDALFSKFVEFNKKAVEVLGYSKKELLNMNPWELRDKDLPDLSFKTLKKLLKDGQVINETVFVTKAGEKLNVEVNSHLISFEGQKMVYSIVRDITNRKKQQKELRRKNEELQKLNRLKTEMVAITSHDLKSPLSKVIIYADLLREFNLEFDRDKIIHYLEIISESSYQMQGFIDEILDLDKIESGRYELNRNKFNLRKLLISSIDINRPAGLKKNVKLALTSRSTNCIIEGDTGKLLQLFNNLITNAIKYSPEAKTVTIQYKKMKEAYRIKISDHGPGIPASEREAIFDRYYQAKRDKKSGERTFGVGLGLYIAKRIVDLHEGTIHVEENKPEGCSFIVELPV